jgi:hypothetical protein
VSSSQRSATVVKGADDNAGDLSEIRDHRPSGRHRRGGPVPTGAAGYVLSMVTLKPR